MFHGLYVDDNAAAGIVDEEVARNGLPDHDTARMDACDRAYHAFGWQPKLKKRVRHLVEGGTAWGGQNSWRRVCLGRGQVK